MISHFSLVKSSHKRTQLIPHLTPWEDIFKKADLVGRNAHAKMMDHSGMGMDMSSDSAAFVKTNSSMARSYWYIIAAVLGFTALLRVVQIAEARTRLVLFPMLPVLLRELCVMDHGLTVSSTGYA